MKIKCSLYGGLKRPVPKTRNYNSDPGKGRNVEEEDDVLFDEDEQEETLEEDDDAEEFDIAGKSAGKNFADLYEYMHCSI